MFKIILAATDRVIARDTTVTAALTLSAHYQSDLQILHVLAATSAAHRNRIRHYASGAQQMATSAYRTEVHARLQRTYAGCRRPAPGVTFKVATGLPWRTIVDHARRIRADLIVMGPHAGHANTRGMVRGTGSIGSSLEGVVMRAHCPVMIVNRDLPPESAAPKRILVGVDFSAACECALGFGVKLSRLTGAHVHIFHMLPVPPYPKYTRADYADDKDMIVERLKNFGGFYLHGAAHTLHVWGGVFPHDELRRCARKVNADLIILGSHTKERGGKWYPGSVVERLGLQATCPVITLSAPNALQPWKDIVSTLRGRENTAVDRRQYIFSARSRR